MFFDEYYSLFLGRDLLRNKTRPQKFFKNHYSSNIFFEKFSEIFNKCEIDVNKNVISKGCWHTNKHTLERQMIPEFDTEFSQMPEFKILNKLKKSAINTLKKLKVSTLPKVEKSDMLYSQFI